MDKSSQPEAPAADVTTPAADPSPAEAKSEAAPPAAAAAARHDAGRVLAAYDTNNDGKLDAEELAAVKADYEALARGETPPSMAAARKKAAEALEASKQPGVDAAEAEKLAKRAARMESHMKGLDRQQRALNALRVRYDADGDGKLSDGEIEALTYDIQTTDTVLRYLGYASTLARTVKYGRVAAAPVVQDKRLLRATFAISWGYVAADVIFEADKSHHVYGNALPEVLRGAAQRFTFQALSSIVFPYLTLRKVIGGTRTLVTNHGTTLPAPVQRWLPQFVGLALIPMMPYVWDRPSRIISKALVGTVWPGEDDYGDDL